MSLLAKIREFHSTLGRDEFYKFYALVTAMGGPPYDYIKVGDDLLNVKKIIRRIRITVMFPRFEVDYAQPYSTDEARHERDLLLSIYEKVQEHDRNLIAKLIKVLEIIASE